MHIIIYLAYLQGFIKLIYKPEILINTKLLFHHHFESAF